MSTPLISVIIPTYNRAHVIERSARSVLDQTLAELELLIIDDGSGDDTRAAVERLGDSRVRYVYQQNAGACAARNHGIDLARGAYIALHDSDDLWYPDKLERQLRCMQETGSDVVLCKLAMCREDGSRTLYPKRVGEGPVRREDDFLGFGTQCIFARREVFEDVRFDPDMPRYQDFDWVYRALKAHRVYCLDVPLVDYFIGADSISASYDKMLRAFALFAGRHPEVVREAPLISLHVVRNLLEGLMRHENAGPETRRQYRRLIRWYYPGLLPCVRSLMHSRLKRRKP